MPELRLVRTAATATVDDLADVLVIAATQSPEGNPTVHCGALDVGDEVRAGLGQALADVGGTGNVGQLNRLPGRPFGLPPVLVVGLGSWPEPPGLGQPVLRDGQLRSEALRRAAGAALLGVQSDRVAVASPPPARRTSRPSRSGASWAATATRQSAHRRPRPGPSPH
jgi:hypothetical protein